MGRSSTYTQEIADTIVTWVANGKTLREFCRQEGMPHWTTVYDWIEADAEFSLRFARARDMGHDAIAEEALEIADTPLEGVRTETTSGESGATKEVREDMLGHRKLQIETRLKLLAKWNPKKYGDLVKVAGHDGGALQTQNKNFNTNVPDDPVEAARFYRDMINADKPKK